MSNHTSPYHYVESGLDNIWLINGVEEVKTPQGREIRIKDIEGLHKEIGRNLIQNKKNLNGKEIRFLRKEMLLSQAFLAKLFEVSEQTIHRWETGKADIPKSAEALVRFLYGQHFTDDKNLDLKKKLQQMADLEDFIDGQELNAKKTNNKWQVQVKDAA